ncbi:unnamed protein product [Phytomonas sp. EM1]|nr:unnamed protein product [Phytomonas sp. EM1]|eukprot:CCW62609.1 unnamed protein product [Phytomonas sp. isolate EM1]
MPLFFDDLVVLGFHDVKDAPGIHSEFKKHGVDAAVVDHAYIVSHLHLAVSFYRFKSEGAHDTGISISSAHTESASNVTAKKYISDSKRGRPSTARDIFAALSPSHNLDRILQVLPAGSKTDAVLVILQKDTYESQKQHILDCIIRKSSQPDGTEKAKAHLLAHRRSGLFPFLEYVDTEKVMKFYGITERDKYAMAQSFTLNESHALAQEVLSTDIAVTLAAFHAKQNMCKCPGDRTACAKSAISMMVGAKALEQCVVNKLSLCDI